MMEIIEAVAYSFKVSQGDILGRRRTKDIALARQVAMYLYRQLTDLTLVETGRIFGKSYHNVHCAYNSIGDRLYREPILKLKVSEIAMRCKIE